MQPHPMTNFELKKYYQNKPKFNGVFSRNSLPKIKYEVYIINLDEYKSIGIQRMALYKNRYNVTEIDCFGIEYIPKKLKNSEATNISTTNYSKMSWYFSIGLTDFMLKVKRKNLSQYTNLLSPS